MARHRACRQSISAGIVNERPYLADALGGEPFSLSDAYISRNSRRPSLTAVRHIERNEGFQLGFMCSNIDLPLTREVYQQPDQWVQMKGDPAIRVGLFYQQWIESPRQLPGDRARLPNPPLRVGKRARLPCQSARANAQAEREYDGVNKHLIAAAA